MLYMAGYTIPFSVNASDRSYLNASHFYWDRKYTMNEVAVYIKKLQPDIVCF